MPDLHLLRPDHASAVLAFESANRGYFAASVPDRGDAYFDHFADRFGALLAEQAAGVCAFHVLVAADGEVLGRFNLVDIEDGEAVLGYRVAEHATGRGVATAAVRSLSGLAVSRYGLRALRAAAALRNTASRRVLVKSGFTAVGPADPAELSGQPGTWYRLDLTTWPDSRIRRADDPAADA